MYRTQNCGLEFLSNSTFGQIPIWLQARRYVGVPETPKGRCTCGGDRESQGAQEGRGRESKTKAPSGTVYRTSGGLF
jgi:hypothetical protein